MLPKEHHTVYALHIPSLKTLGIPKVLVIGYGSVLTKRPDDGSVELKHVALNVFLTINWMFD
jgi:hypothetical protein